VTYEQFLSSLARDDDPPAELGPAARALWLDGKGKWGDAHELAGEIETSEGARVHAYLHRKEGDLDNAGYWYRQARRKPAEGSLEEEWEVLVREFLRT
jgi:hypothetical protein